MTMTDVAERAGVSKAAVSVVLSDHKGNIGVSEATRKRVLKIARETGYRPDMAARSLSKRKSFLVGVLCRESRGLLTLELLRGIQDELLDREYSAVTYLHGDKADDEARHIKFSLARQADGLIVTAALDPDGRTNIEMFSTLRNRNMPIVQVFSRTLPNVPSVTVDQFIAGQLAAQHLIDLGHKSIVDLAPEGYTDEEMPGFYPMVRQQWQGYERAMLAAGLKPVVATHGRVAGGLDFTEAAYRAVGEVLDHPASPTAVIVGNDCAAIGLTKGLTEAGVRVPEDISVACCDAVVTNLVPPSAIGTLSFTTVVHPVREIGRTAARMVLSMLDGKLVEDVVFEPRMIVGGSTAPPRHTTNSIGD